MNPARIELPYRSPFSWTDLTAFLAPRAIPGVETVASDLYSHTVLVGDRVARAEIRPDRRRRRLVLEVVGKGNRGLDEAQSKAIAARARALFDLDAHPTEVAAVLSADPALAHLIEARPGLRVPGAWNGFETAVRAILGQQVTVRGATTLCGRLVECYGSKSAGGWLFPEPATLARARFTRVGLPKTRAAALRALAGACASGELSLEADADPVATLERLERLRGIGDWTTQYVAMRVLRQADAFPAGDLGLLRAATELIASRTASTPLRAAGLRRMAERWRPWRAYAAMHLWRSLG